MLESFWQDLRYSARVLVKHPGFTLVVIFTLALGIGANSAIFSVVNAVFLRPLPFLQPDQIMQIWSVDTEKDRIPRVVSVPDYLDWQAQNRSFEQMAAYSFTSFILTGNGEAERIRGARVSASFFPLLRVQPIEGRAFTPEEDRFGGERLAIIGHGLWQRRFGGASNLIGHTIRLSNQTYTIMGIMPPNFNFPVRRLGGTEIWIPHAFDPDNSMSQRSSSYLAVLGRMNEGVTLRQAQTEMDALAKRLSEQYQATNRNRGVYIIPLYEQIVGKIRPKLLILFGAVSFVLLIACTNVANLLLSRVTARYKEMALRTAMGATRSRLICQSLIESVFLGTLGGGLGLLIAFWGLKLLVTMIPPEVPRINDISLDMNVVGWSFGLSILAGLLFGLAPALKFSQPDLTESLKESGRNSTTGPSRGRLRNILVVGEVTLSLILLIGAGLLIKSLWRLQHVETGFDQDNVLTLTLSLPRYKYPDNETQKRFHTQVLERLKNLPGVSSAGITTILPLSGNMEASDFQVVGKQIGASVNNRAISVDYLPTMGINLLKGRPFTENDNENTQPVCLINEHMARQIFANEDPIGQRIETAGAEREVVGLVSNVKHEALTVSPDYEMYVPYTQFPFVSSMTYALRCNLEPTSLFPSVRSAVSQIDADQTVDNLQTMNQALLKSIAEPRFNTFMLSLFAGVALLIASIGLYGVLSYSVSQRIHEIGIRMALGARKSNVLGLVIKQGLYLTLIGIAIGIPVAYATSYVLASLLFEVSTTDAWTFIAIPMLLILVAIIASYVPARRAAKVDPMVALRYE